MSWSRCRSIPLPTCPTPLIRCADKGSIWFVYRTRNLAGSSFPSIAKAAQRAKIPVFGFLGAIAPQGAAVVLSRDYYDMALDAGQLAARVIRGESPAKIPLHQCARIAYWSTGGGRGVRTQVAGELSANRRRGASSSFRRARDIE